jgi:hypothetical protein
MVSRYTNPANLIRKNVKAGHIAFYRDVGLVRALKICNKTICRTARIESVIERSHTKYVGTADGKEYEIDWLEDGTWSVWWQNTWEEPKVFDTLERSLLAIHEWQG